MLGVVCGGGNKGVDDATVGDAAGGTEKTTWVF